MRVRLLPVFALFVAAALALPASAFVIYLKGGDQVTAREKPVAQGKFLVFYTPLGAMQKIPLSEYDEKKTEEMNGKGTGDAYVLGDSPQDKNPDGSKKPSLSEYIQVHKKGSIGEDRKPVEVARESRKGAGLNEPAGNTLDPQVEALFVHTLETYGVKTPRVSQAPAGVRVQGVAETEDQVFAALKGIAKALAESRSGRQALPKADIYLSTSTGENAGHFEMSIDDADALVGGKRTPASWFMANVAL
jgi:hypothetical protein